MSKLVLSLLKADLFGHTGATAKMPFCDRNVDMVIDHHYKIEVRVSSKGRVAFVFYGNNNRMFTYPGTNHVGNVNINDVSNLVITYEKCLDSYVCWLNTGNVDKLLCNISFNKMKTLFDKVSLQDTHESFIHYVNTVMDDKLPIEKHLTPFKNDTLNSIVKSLPEFCNKPRSLNTPFCIGGVKLFSGSNLINHLRNNTTYKWHTTMCGMIYKDIVIMWDIKNYKGVFYSNKPLTDNILKDIVKSFNLMDPVLSRINKIIANNYHI